MNTRKLLGSCLIFAFIFSSLGAVTLSAGAKEREDPGANSAFVNDSAAASAPAAANSPATANQPAPVNPTAETPAAPHNPAATPGTAPRENQQSAVTPPPKRR